LYFGGEVDLLNSKALTKIQSIILITVIIVATIGGAVAYVLLSGKETAKTIKIGILQDLDASSGKSLMQGAVLAAEQLNAEGGILGRQIEVVGEDTDVSTGVDATKFNSALIKLLSYHKVDFIIGGSASLGFMVQDLVAEFKRIFFEVGAPDDVYTQRVLEEYDIGKYYFRVAGNATSAFTGITDSLLHLKEQTGFNRVGLIGTDGGWAKGAMDGLEVVLPELGFEVVYREVFPLGTFDFTSYFARAEQTEVEIMVPMILFDDGLLLLKEYHERQSQMIIYSGYIGGGISEAEGWEITEGRCEYLSISAIPFVAGYPLTSKTIPDREAYIDRWGEVPRGASSVGYNTLRYILPDAIERAETFETEAVIQALERTSFETTDARNFVFTSSHDMMMGENPNDPDADYPLVLLFQWIDEKLVPVYPKKIMEEAGVNYTFPDWPGPWDNIS
jgi:branched-chain amino acid transport system substrate-binding protein